MRFFRGNNGSPVNTHTNTPFGFWTLRLSPCGLGASPRPPAKLSNLGGCRLFVFSSFFVTHCPTNVLACCGLGRASASLQGIFKARRPLEIRAELGQADGGFL